MRFEKYKMFLSAARNAAPEQREVFYQRAFQSAEEAHGTNSPEVIAVLLAMSSHLKEQESHAEAAACQERARDMFRAP